jgi:CspA family cold shock protein
MTRRKERTMPIGTVKFYNSSKGFGFIAPEGGAKDVFVHATALEAAGMTSLSEGQKVSFDIQPDAKGSKAVNIQNA